jgi:hypothetical protein
MECLSCTPRFAENDFSARSSLMNRNFIKLSISLHIATMSRRRKVTTYWSGAKTIMLNACKSVSTGLTIC